MKRVPLAAVPSQTLTIVLAQQACQIAVYTRGALMYLDLTVGGVAIVTGRICRNLARLLRDAGYRGFVGDFVFVDTQTAMVLDGDDPNYLGLEDRFQLVYLEAADLP